ncbi:MAG: MarR family winged helix-turn-helix transcriptional regulator [Xanthobacteraceae bacterium]
MGSTRVTDRRLELENYLPYLINRVGAALVVRFAQDTLAKQGLSIAMWRVLAALSTNGEQRQIDLAEMTSIDTSTLSRLVARLVRMGLVTRKRSKTNNREVVVQLTARGRALVERLIPIAENLEKTAIAEISPKDLSTLKRCLRLMYKNLAHPRYQRPGRGPPAQESALWIES